MTNYAGENIIFKTSAKDASDAEATLTESDVTSVTITIVDSSGVEVITGAAMSWDATDLEWRYVWTSPGTEDTFQARMHIVGPQINNWEYAKVKTKANPF